MGKKYINFRPLSSDYYRTFLCAESETRSRGGRVFRTKKYIKHIFLRIYRMKTLLDICCEFVAPRLTRADSKSLPEDVYDPIRKTMSKERQVDVFDEYKKWYKNGQLKNHYHYKDGKRHGECKWWYESGNRQEHAHYKDGKKYGEFKHWYWNGQLWQHYHCKDGKKHGKCKWWYVSGKRWEHAHYKYGKKHGEFKEWYCDGRLLRHLHFRGGKVTCENKKLCLE